MIALLKNGKLWLTLLVVNGTFLELQPLVLAASLALVVFLFIAGNLPEVWRRLHFSPRGQRILLIALLWLLSAGLLGSYFEKKGWIRRNEDGMLLLAGVNTALWLIPAVVYRLLRQEADRVRFLEQQSADARAAGERKRAQKRREDARAGCEFFYNLHAPELAGRFDRQMYDGFVSRHMGDDRAPEEVEERGQQLLEILRGHLEKAAPPEKKMTLASLTAWFLEEKRQVEEAALSEDDRGLLLAQLEERYVKLQEKYLRSVQP